MRDIACIGHTITLHFNAYNCMANLSQFTAHNCIMQPVWLAGRTLVTIVNVIITIKRVCFCDLV